MCRLVMIEADGPGLFGAFPRIIIHRMSYDESLRIEVASPASHFALGRLRINLNLRQPQIIGAYANCRQPLPNRKRISGIITSTHAGLRGLLISLQLSG